MAKRSLVSIEYEILTPNEAADFLRLSRSTVYQRLDIPRHRLPKSRQIRFIRSELLAWMKGEHKDVEDFIGKPDSSQSEMHEIDNGASHVYHRNTRYR
jgi:excisionase family DNA binding protein